jgi:hypothetical protein
MKRVLLSYAILITSIQCWGAALKLQAVNPATRDQINVQFGAASQVLSYLNNDTYLSDPTQLIGCVLVIRQSGSNSRENPTFELMPMSGIELTTGEPRYAKTVRSLVITKNAAASLSYLAFLNAELEDSNVASVIVNNELIQRVDKKKTSWKTAILAWKEENRELMSDPNVTEILVVEGFVLKSITHKKYSLVKGKASGFYGVSVGGAYYISNEESNIDYIFGIDFGSLKSKGQPTMAAGTTTVVTGQEVPRIGALIEGKTFRPAPPRNLRLVPQ